MHLAPLNLTSHVARGPAADGHSCPPSPPADSLSPFRTCTAHDPSPSRYSVDDILQIILKTRKSWKTLKGQSEAVWPPYLEATMLKALQEYEPDDSRETRILGRYPMRNRFISDYIHNTTGKYRSAKQVGSRLQQLRDTPEGRELIDVLTRCYRTRRVTGSCDARVPVCQPSSWDDSSSSPSVSTIFYDSSSTPSDSSTSPTSPIMPRFPQPRPRQPIESRMPVYIDILPQRSPWSHDSSASASSTSRAPDAPRHIGNIDPTVTFVSPSPVNGKSSYIVLLDGAPVHTEDTILEYVGPYFTSSTGQAPGDEPTLYNTALVPNYWDVLCKAPDPTLYTIVQDVYRLPDPIPNQEYPQRPRPMRIFSATYRFQYVSAVAGSTSPYGQPPIGISATRPSAASTYSGQMVQGSMPMNPAQATPFPTPSRYPAPASEPSRGPTEQEQNLFDEPFMLDVNFDQFGFDDIVMNMDASSDAAHLFTGDPHNYLM